MRLAVSLTTWWYRTFWKLIVRSLGALLQCVFGNSCTVFVWFQDACTHWFWAEICPTSAALHLPILSCTSTSSHPRICRSTFTSSQTHIYRPLYISVFLPFFFLNSKSFFSQLPTQYLLYKIHQPFNNCTLSVFLFGTAWQSPFSLSGQPSSSFLRCRVLHHELLHDELRRDVRGGGVGLKACVVASEQHHASGIRSFTCRVAKWIDELRWDVGGVRWG